MSASEFLRQHTVAREGEGISFAEMRKEYVREHGPISRTTFITELAKDGFKVVCPPGRGAFIIDRALVTA